MIGPGAIMPLLWLLACDDSGGGTWAGWPKVPPPSPHVTPDDPAPVVDVHKIREPAVPVDLLVADLASVSLENLAPHQPRD